MGHAWQWIYPPLASHACGWLEVSDGHAIFWEEAGHPGGVPVLFVHGGPGAGCTARDRRWFDSARYRIVTFDQRGCGRSTAHDALAANTLAHLLDDMEALRRLLGIERWLLFGGSWGATLALSYAQRHPHRTLGLVLRGVFAGSAAERRWLYGPQGAARLQPGDWQRFIAPLARPVRDDGDLLDAYAQQLGGADPGRRITAARAWWRWEQSLMDDESQSPPADGADDDAILTIARMGVHYARHHYFLAEGQLLAQAGCLDTVPGVIVQGGRDRVTPPGTAFALHRAWRGSRLQWVDAAGHASSDAKIARQLIAATDGFATAARRPALAC